MGRWAREQADTSTQPQSPPSPSPSPPPSPKRLALLLGLRWVAAAGSNANATVGGESGGMLVVRGDCAAVMAALTGTSRPRRMADAQADALALLTRIEEACMMPVEFELVPRVRNGAADAVASEAFVIAAELELRSIRAALDDAAGGGDGRQAATEAHCARANLEGALASLEDPSLASLCGAQTCSDLLLALLDRAEEHGEWELLMRAATEPCFSVGCPKRQPWQIVPARCRGFHNTATKHQCGV